MTQRKRWPVLRALLALLAPATSGLAQLNVPTPLPSASVPETPPEAPAPGENTPSATQAPAATATGPAIRQIIVTEGVQAAQALPEIPGGDYVIVQPSVSFLDRQELARRLANGEGQPATQQLLSGIALVVETYAKEKGFPIASAVIPPQNLAGGTVRVALLRGKIRDIKMEGANWFSESLLRRKLSIERGATLQLSELDRAIAWTNSNPFRRVRVHVQPVSATEADLIVGVDERMPLRLTASYDNTGNAILGENRYAAGLTYANLWGRDHQATYQFITSDDIDVFRAHVLDYRVPLPWRHVFNASASYTQVNAAIDEEVAQKGESITADAKYIVPFRAGRWRGELNGGISFKQTNNNLEFTRFEYQFTSLIDVLTANFGGAAIREDKRGHWLVTANLVGSAGTFNSRSTREKFERGKSGANPRFYYTQLSAQRSSTVTPTITATLRALIQFSSSSLVPTEQLSLGGLATVRGYEERILSGDSGHWITHELQKRFPSISLGKRLPTLDLAALYFIDYGLINVRVPDIGQRESDYLFSAGVGLRASLGNHLSASVEYARQIEEVEVDDADHHRVHMRVTFSW